MPVPLVQEQKGRVTVVGVGVARPENLAERGHAGLTQEDIQIAVAIDISTRDRHRVYETRVGRPNQFARLFETAADRASKEH